MLLNDLRFALRVFGKNRLFTVAAISSIALAIGANTAVFSLVNAVLVRQLPYRDAQHLVWIWSTRTDRDKAFFCLPDLADFQQQNHTLDEMVAFSPWGANFTGITPAERFQGVRVTANVFQMLGVQAAVGRLLEPADDFLSSQRVLVLSHGLWIRRFGGDPGIIGRSYSVGADPYTVIGVLPPGFIFPGEKAEILTAMMPGSDPQRGNRDFHFMRVFARMKPLATREQVYEDMAAITARLHEAYPVTKAKNTPPHVSMLSDEIVGSYKAGLWIVMGAVALVLLIACFNLANLLLAKSSSRQREITVRLALGAGQFRIVRQMFTESLVLAVLGGAAGAGLALLGIRSLSALAPADLPRLGEIGVDSHVLLFTLLLTILAAFTFGLAPALQLSRISLNQRSATSGGARLRRMLLLGEVAFSLILLAAAGLLIRGFAQLQAVAPGFDMPGLVNLALSPPGAVIPFSEKVLTAVREMPDVQSAAMATLLPLGGGNARSDYFIAGRQPAAISDYPAAQVRWVSPDYFRTMGIPVRGREFQDLDGPQGSPVVMVDESLAARFFEHSSAVGQHLVIDQGNGEPRVSEIVGVAGPVKHFSLDEETLNTIYIPLYQTWPAFIPKRTSTVRLVVRSHGDPARTGDAIRVVLGGIANDVPSSAPRTLEQDWTAAIASRKFNRTLLADFAGVALLLAASGLYALISYSVARRTREIGVRVALGAGSGSILSLIVREGLSIVLPGVVAGLIGSIWVGRLIEGMLYKTQAFDPITMLVASTLLVLVAIVAMLFPAWKATRIDPLTALRME